MNIMDPRQQGTAQQTQAHGGFKPQRLNWYGNTGKILTVGTSEFNERQWALFDPRGDITKPLVMKKLDNLSSPMTAHYDHDMGILFVTNKGA